MTSTPVARDSVESRFIPIVEMAIGVSMTLAVILARPRDGGPQVFFEMANKVATGLVPYRDFLLEYPPLALVPLTVPRLLGGHVEEGYQVPFLIIAFLTSLAVGACVVWLADRGWSALPRNSSLVAFAALFLAASPQVLWRFDIFAALFTIVALVAVASGRPGWAGFSLALGTAVKLYPAFLVPVLFAYYAFGRKWRSATMVVFGFVAFVAALGALLIFVAGRDAFTVLTYQEDRGVELESVVGGLVLLARNLFHSRAFITFGFGSFQVESPLLATLSPLNAIAMLVLGFVMAITLALAFDRDGRRYGVVQPLTLINFLTATLLLVMIANKVLSPQYVAWLLPFGALLPWRKSLLLVVICALTTIEYPIAFDALRRFETLPVFVLNLRNLLLVVMFFWLILPQRSPRTDESQIEATFEMPPTKPAATPNISSPMASFLRRGAMRIMSSAAKATVAILARVRPGRPAVSAS
jgi:hypothetical protein